jgi:hypothetical protein
MTIQQLHSRRLLKPSSIPSSLLQAATLSTRRRSIRQEIFLTPGKGKTGELENLLLEAAAADNPGAIKCKVGNVARLQRSISFSEIVGTGAAIAFAIGPDVARYLRVAKGGLATPADS